MRRRECCPLPASTDDPPQPAHRMAGRTCPFEVISNFPLRLRAPSGEVIPWLLGGPKVDHISGSRAGPSSRLRCPASGRVPRSAGTVPWQGLRGACNPASTLRLGPPPAAGDGG